MCLASNTTLGLLPKNIYRKKQKHLTTHLLFKKEKKNKARETIRDTKIKL